MATTPAAAPDGFRAPKRNAGPKPAEVIAFYRSKGLDQEKACEKAIETLQQALAASVKRNQTQPERIALLEAQVVNVGKAVGDLDKKLSRMEYKLDSKPGFGGVFAAGVAAGGFLRGVLEGAPHVLQAITQATGSISESIRQKSSKF